MAVYPLFKLKKTGFILPNLRILNVLDMFYRSVTSLLFVLLMACSSPKPAPGKEVKAFVMKETLVKGSDTGMVKKQKFVRDQLFSFLCQRWELSTMEGVADATQVMDKNNKRIFPSLFLFPDSTLVENVRSHFKTGTWTLNLDAQPPQLICSFGKDMQKIYPIRRIATGSLELQQESEEGTFHPLQLSSDGWWHQNYRNDPFHISNLRWMIKPKKKESNEEVFNRTLECLRFYALYFRDNIKRQGEEISFLGLPDIFQWYSGGIGLPEKELLEDSFRNCYYNRQQAEKAYEMLRRLIVDHEFNWSKETPNWVYQTHDVLEQMVHKMEERKAELMAL